MMKYNIGFIGLGKLGSPVVEVIKQKHNVVSFDIKYKNNVFDKCVIGQDIIFIAVPTPHEEQYDGKYVCSDLEPKDFDYSIVEDTLKKIDQLSTENQIIVLISTVLPGTIKNKLSKLITKGSLLYNPYLIAMGTVKEDFINPEMIMIGGNNTEAILTLKKFYYTLCNCDRYVLGTWEEIESVKIFYNTFITSKIVFCNMIQDVAMKIGNMNVDVVTTALAESTQRIISKKYMKAGMGDGGGCHPRDNIALRWLAKELDLGYDLFGGLIHAREQQAKNMADYLTKLSKEYNLPIVIIGKSFKPDLKLEDGSPSILISQFCTCTFDDLSKPAIFLLAHSSQTTFNKTNEEYTFPKNSIVVDPWRERKNSLHYGDSNI